LQKRQVVGMHHDDQDETLLGKRITIRGKISTESLPNQGIFGRKFISNEWFYFFLLFLTDAFSI